MSGASAAGAGVRRRPPARRALGDRRPAGAERGRGARRTSRSARRSTSRATCPSTTARASSSPRGSCGGRPCRSASPTPAPGRRPPTPPGSGSGTSSSAPPRRGSRSSRRCSSPRSASCSPGCSGGGCSAPPSGSARRRSSPSCPLVWEYYGLLYPEALAVPAALLLYLLFLERPPTARLAIAVGVVAGVGLLIRPSSVFVFAGILAAWVLAAGWRRGSCVHRARRRRSRRSRCCRGRSATTWSPTAP